MIHNNSSFTLIEILAIVIVLGIIAAIAITMVSGSMEDATEAAVERNSQIAQEQIGYYRRTHDGRPPHLNGSGELDTANFVARLTGRTDPDGRINPDGSCYPTLTAWPRNLYWQGEAARAISFGTGDPPSPAESTTGWYYNTDTCLIHAIGPSDE